jgi:hypothetical protein
MDVSQSRSPLGTWALLVIGLSVYRAHAQGGPPMITDDPGTPGNTHWEINLAALIERTASARIEQLPLLDLNYGVGDRVQLKYEVPWVLEEDNGDLFSGLGNSLLGIKWRFYDAGAAGWQVSTYPQLQVNNPGVSSPRRGLAEPGTSWLLPLEFAHSYPSFDLDLEFGRWHRPTGQPDSWIAGIVIGRQLNKVFEVMAELHDETASGSGRHEVILNFGARRDLSEHYTVLISAGRDLSDTLFPKGNLLGYLGLQLHF